MAPAEIKAEDKPVCPECGSVRLYKDGMRYLADGSSVQCFLCRVCGYRFSLAKRERPLQKSLRQNLKGNINYNNNRQICASEGGAKNLAGKAVSALAEAEGKTTSGPAGATTPSQTSQADVKGKIVEYAWWMKKQGYSDVTIRVNVSALRTLINRGAKLDEPETVKETIAKQNWSETRKHGVIAAYNLYVKMHGLHWEPPFCRVTRKLPFIPTEQEIDALIASCGSKTSAFLELLKQTAMRAGEAIKLKWTDIDFERRTITLNAPEKGCNPRVWKVSQKLIDMLSRLPKKNEYVFGGATVASLKSSFWHSRKRAAFKLQNPRLNRIGFHSFRHWRATTLYHQTKDPLFVKEFLGHKKLDSTLLYIQLEQALYKEESSEFHVAIARTPEEIKALLEVGFEYICQKDDILYFRKRK
jgi:integrase